MLNSLFYYYYYYFLFRLMIQVVDLFALLDDLKNMKACLNNDFSFFKRATTFLVSFFFCFSVLFSLTKLTNVIK